MGMITAQSFQRFSRWQIVVSFILCILYLIAFILFLQFLQRRKTALHVPQSGVPKAGTPRGSPGTAPSFSDTRFAYIVSTTEEDGQTESKALSIWKIPALGGKKELLATLPKESKQIYLFDTSTLLYITNPDIAGLGDSIRLRTIPAGSEQTIYTPPEKFFIDSYVISPDKKNLVIWLVAPTVDGYKGGTSRIVLTTLSTPGVEKLVLEGQISGPTHYPLFWSKGTNRLYFGTFSPGGAMNQGIVSLDPNGDETIVAEAGLENGAYGGVLSLSPSGRWVAVVRQTAKQTSNLPELMNGFIPTSQRNTNAIVLHDVVAHTRRVVEENTKGKIFSNLLWGKTDDTLYALESEIVNGTISPKAFKKYTFSTNASQTVGANAEGELITVLADGSLLLGMRVEPVGLLGGIESPVSAVFGSYYLLRPDNSYQKVYTDMSSQFLGIQ